MNRYLALGCLGLGLMVSPLLAPIATSAVPANQKIAIIDLDNTLSTTPAGKRANAAFERTRKAKQSQLDKEQDQLKRAQADLDRQKQVMKPEAYEQKRQELEKRFVNLQQTYVKLERDLAGERTKLIQDLLKQASPKIEKIAKQEGVAIILDREAVIWAQPAVDLTPQLNALMK
jgi:Skp family chaperone for outer membrane proteins